MTYRPLSLLLLVCATMTSAGCKRETPEEAAEKQIAPLRPVAAARIAALKKLVPTLRAAPALTADTFNAPPGTIKFDGATGYDPVTAGLLYEANLDDLDAFHNKDPEPMPKAGLFGACAALLTGTANDFVSGDNRVRVFQRCTEAKYVVLVRTLERVKPLVNEEEKTFTAGLHRGEVHVFELDSGKNLGGFRFSETSKDVVKTRGISNPTEIDKDLSYSVEAAIEAGLNKPAP